MYVKAKRLHCVNFKAHRSGKRLLPIDCSRLGGATRTNLILLNLPSSDFQELKLCSSYNSSTELKQSNDLSQEANEFKETMDIIRLRRMEVKARQLRYSSSLIPFHEFTSAFTKI